MGDRYFSKYYTPVRSVADAEIDNHPLRKRDRDRKLLDHLRSYVPAKDWQYVMKHGQVGYKPSLQFVRDCSDIGCFMGLACNISNKISSARHSARIDCSNLAGGWLSFNKPKLRDGGNDGVIVEYPNLKIKASCAVQGMSNLGYELRPGWGWLIKYRKTFGFEYEKPAYGKPKVILYVRVGGAARVLKDMSLAKDIIDTCKVMPLGFYDRLQVELDNIADVFLQQAAVLCPKEKKIKYGWIAVKPYETHNMTAFGDCPDRAVSALRYRIRHAMRNLDTKKGKTK